MVKLEFKKLAPNMVTFLSLVFSLYALLVISDGEYVVGAWFLTLSMICDSFDGKIARKLGVSSKFGAELDSLADFVSFGVVPGFLAYKAVLQDFGAAGMAITLYYILSGGFRLAKFNCELDNLEVKGSFKGLPIPMAAWVVSSFVIFQYTLWDGILHKDLFIYSILGVSFLMTSPFEFPSNFRDYFSIRVGKTIKISLLISLILSVKYAYFFNFVWSILYILISLSRIVYIRRHQIEVNH